LVKPHTFFEVWVFAPWHGALMLTQRTALLTRLNESQRLQLEDYIGLRLDSLEAAMAEFRRKRGEYEDQARDCFDWRVTTRNRDKRKPEEIFIKQNDSLNLVGGFAEYVAAKSRDDIFGSEPYFSLSPEGKEDKEFALRLEKHSQWKLRQGRFLDAAKQAIPVSITMGECVLKVRWTREVDYFESERNVMVDGAGKPILTSAGDYIFDDDEILLEVPLDEMGQPMADAEPVSKRVAKDPELNLAGVVTSFRSMFIEEEQVRFENVDAFPVHFRDFIAPLDVARLEDADLVGQGYDISLTALRGQYEIAEELLEILKHGKDERKEEQPDETKEKRGDDEALINPTLTVAECIVRIDPLGDGKIRRLFVLYARESKKIIWADYLHNVTPDGTLPFFAIPCFEVQNRWYGRGYFERFAADQAYIDRQFCYVNHRNRHSGVLGRFIKRDGVRELDDTNELIIDPEKWYDVEPNKDVRDIAHIVTVPDLDERTWQMMNMRVQLVQLRAGVGAANQGGATSLPQSHTATGIEAILASGSVLAKEPIQNMKSGIEAALYYAIRLIYANFDAEETFTYEEGDQTILAQINPEELRNLHLNVRLMMTRFSSLERRESAINAMALLQGYIALPEEEKEFARPLVVQGIKGWGIEDADSVVRPPLPPPSPVDPGLATGEPLPPEQTTPTGEPVAAPEGLL
jgi:hypothetical protein